MSPLSPTTKFLFVCFIFSFSYFLELFLLSFFKQEKKVSTRLVSNDKLLQASDEIEWKVFPLENVFLFLFLSLIKKWKFNSIGKKTFLILSKHVFYFLWRTRNKMRAFEKFWKIDFSMFHLCVCAWTTCVSFFKPNFLPFSEIKCQLNIWRSLLFLMSLARRLALIGNFYQVEIWNLNFSSVYHKLVW